MYRSKGEDDQGQ